jgi:Family of unknown function (DUF6519)
MTMPNGDFSLNPYHYRENVSRVLYQMGRVQLDSDFNEQTESSLRFLRGLGTDVIGVHGGLDGGFKIVPGNAAGIPFNVRFGVYYVDGIRVFHSPFQWPWEIAGTDANATKDNAEKYNTGLLATEDDQHFLGLDLKPTVSQLLYLAVWERHVSAAEADEIREIALLGPDTTTRAVVTWQIRSMPFDSFEQLIQENFNEWDTTLFPPADLDQPKWDVNYVALNYLLRSGALMTTKAKENKELEPCEISPEARFRGLENRLYRVEIHSTNPKTTFKWSPDNAAIVYPIRKIEDTTVHLDSLGLDDRTAIRKNDWVEVVDDDVALRPSRHGTNNALRRVVDVKRQQLIVELDKKPENDAGTHAHAILRRWADDAQPFDEKKSIELSDGVEVNFSHADTPKGGFRVGDYWLIPARTATADVIWPQTNATPPVAAAIPPHGVDVHYAPLARWIIDPTGTRFEDLRRRFQSMAVKVPPV